MKIEIDRFPVSELRDRFNIGRTALYERMNTLSIKPMKQGIKSYVSGEQLRWMDELDAHLKSGGGLADFVQSVHQTSSEQIEQLSLPMSQSVSLTQSLPMVAVIEGIVQSVFTRLAPQPPQGGMRLAHLRELEEAYEKKWILSTSELADLLGLSASTVRGYGDQFQEAGFIFTRAGTRSRGEMAWKIGKIEIFS